MEMMTMTRRAMWLGLAVVMACGSATLRAASDPAGFSDSNLVDVVLKATERYRDPADAENQGWASMNSCVSSPEEGAMGVHFVKGSILFDGDVDPQEPEALIYEVKRGRARLVAAEFIITAAEWHAKHGAAPPVILGQHPNFVGSPNRFGLPAFYELHVWAWRPNVKGTFVDFNPAVSCTGFEPAESAATAHAHGRP
jgi:hypothetical protein